MTLALLPKRSERKSNFCQYIHNSLIVRHIYSHIADLTSPSALVTLCPTRPKGAQK